MRILVGVAYYGWSRPICETSIANMLQPIANTKIKRYNVIGKITDDARNDIVETAKKNGFDYILFLDSDMLFPKDTLNKLVNVIKENPKAKAASGIYCGKKSGRIHVYKYSKKEDAFYNLNSDFDKNFDLNSGIYKADAVGTGCLLIATSAFKKKQYPWFYYQYTGKIRWSEDLTFFHKNRMKIYVDTSLICKHVVEMAVVPVSGKEFTYETISSV